MARSDRSALVALATSVVDAFSAGDWDRVRAEIADDLEFTTTGTAAEFHDADAFVAHLQRVRAALPDLRCEVLETTTSGTLAILNIRWTATHTGTLHTSIGDILPSGRIVNATSRWLFRENHGRVSNIRALDTLGLLGQFGRPDQEQSTP
jgi:predicted ester cyclase